MTWGQPAQGTAATPQWGTPASNQLQQTAAANSNSSFNNYVNQGIAYNAPTFAQYGLQQNAGIRNIAYGNAGYGMDQTGLQNDYTSASRDLGLQRGINGIDLAAAQRQPQLIDQLLGLDNKDFDLSRADAGLSATEKMQNLFEQATGQGAMLTTGRKQRQGNIYQSLANQMGHIDVGQDKNTLNAAEQKKQAQDRIDTLAMTSQRLGMKPEELKSQLDNNLAKLGLNHAISTEDLLDGLAKGDLQSKQLLMQILSQAGQYATAGK